MDAMNVEKNTGKQKQRQEEPMTQDRACPGDGDAPAKLQDQVKTKDTVKDTAETATEEEVDLAQAAGELAAAYAVLEKEAENLRQSQTSLTNAKEELEHQLIRLSADFDNFRRRTGQEKEQWRRDLVAEMVADLFPVLDNFRLALGMMEKDAAAAKHLTGLTMIYRQFNESLKSKGLEEVSPADEAFDPKWHEAIGNTEVTEPEKDGVVTDVVQPGYRIGDKMIRPAMVRVGKYEQE